LQETDTQVAVWVNRFNNDLVIAFRGTEPSIKDLQIDLMVNQEPLSRAKDSRLVHAGFRKAFLSVKDSLYRVLEGITGDTHLQGWKFDCTGHSLGVSGCRLKHHSRELSEQQDN